MGSVLGARGGGVDPHPRAQLVVFGAVLVGGGAPLRRVYTLVSRARSLRLAALLRLPDSLPVLLERACVSLEALEPVADGHHPALSSVGYRCNGNRCPLMPQTEARSGT